MSLDCSFVAWSCFSSSDDEESLPELAVLSSSELDSSDSSGFLDFLVVSGELDLLDALLELSGVGGLVDFLAAMAAIGAVDLGGGRKKKSQKEQKIGPARSRGPCACTK